MVTKGDVATIVYKYVAKNTVFTVANVVQKLRARGFYCSYNEVKGLVAECMASIDNYVSSSIAKPAKPIGISETSTAAMEIAIARATSIFNQGSKAKPQVQPIKETAISVKPVTVGNRGRVWVNLKNIVKPGCGAVIYEYPNELEIVDVGLSPNLNKPKPRNSYVYNADDTPGIKVPQSIIKSAFGQSAGVLTKYVYKDRVVLRKK